MSFEAFCRECDRHFADPAAKVNHVALFHYGITPQPPAIPETIFYAINASNPQVKAKTCPVCWLHFPNLAHCIAHVADKHPVKPITTSSAPTRDHVVADWKELAKAQYPKYFNEFQRSDDDSDFEVQSVDFSDIDSFRV
ncbi:hypothetical protein GCK72_011939 [Caenorhabditis remanei]|uniref:C2H2-type domain-containing protein n=1 Tax=Caenorhabditis remanei TaxID=31234 RepID=A0A6A5GME4_CAERE|nr:hypothetical protein GCK72_011939 [Caenorhabditis remanei]KAF1755489.1 hypothetical protein GCK72_011939 [Caenorhabditis remanei]